MNVVPTPARPRGPRSRNARRSLATLVVVLGAAALLLPAGLSLGTAHGAGVSTGRVAEETDVTGASTSGNSSWHNISSSVGPGPSERSISQAAYSPALNATILFGGYNGVGGNFALGDTWSFSDNTWTALDPAVSPAPRWGATMVYDPELQALVMFGGRNADAFFNDTWEYNATGWHNVTSPVAPSPRYDYGMVYDAALGEVVLFGGGTGNDPAGTFTGFVFYNDTWAFQDGAWTNITSSAGPAPVGRLIRGQMAYDAADGYALLSGGYSYVPLGTPSPCGYVIFEPAWAQTWKFAGGTWSEVAGPVPPVGMGVIWFDAEANETLYYEGMWLGSGGTCDVSGNQVWSYSAGNWTLVTEGNISAPVPREQPVFVDDEADHEQLEFGGEAAANASEYVAGYLGDTWTYQPTWVTFQQTGLPAGAEWQVAVSGTTGHLSEKALLFVEAPGTYSYQAQVTAPHEVGTTVQGRFTLVHGPVVVVLRFTGALTPVPGASALPLSVVLGATVAGAAVGAVVTVAAARLAGDRLRRRWRKEGDRLVEGLVSEPSHGPSPRRP